MILHIFFAFFCILGVAEGLWASEQDAWWDICNNCSSDNDFRDRALSIPPQYTNVYITNEDSNVTQRYQRSVTVEHVGDTRIISLTAVRVIMPAPEKQAFESAVESANTRLISISRDNIGGAPLGRDSVVGDLTTGRVSEGLLIGLMSYLDLNGYRGSISQVPSETSVDIGMLSYELQIQPDGDLRDQPLQIIINYESGSTLTLELSADFSTWTGVHIQDDEGQTLRVEDPDDPTSLLDPISGQQMFFETINELWLENLRQALDERSSLECRSEIIEDRVTVICQRGL